MILNNIQEIKKSIPSNVNLIAVSKTQSYEKIRLASNLIKDFGENYLQEALHKQEKLKDLNINWHFIGSIQSNKLKIIANSFHYVHSVSKLSYAEKLSKYRDREKFGKLKIFLQVNLDIEETKSGFTRDQILNDFEKILSLTNLDILGLMSIPKISDNIVEKKESFQKVANLQNKINSLFQVSLQDLSIGMSDDYLIAILCGSNFIRIGSKIFGERHY